MENNEIMNFEDIDVMTEEIVADEATGMSAGVGMLIGAGLTLAIGAGVKLAKKLYANYKAKKELRQPDEAIEVEPEDVEAVAAK